MVKVNMTNKCVCGFLLCRQNRRVPDALKELVCMQMHS
jgi:hypothetical protein